MALKIENEKIVGTIDNLEDKLNGEIPVTREELLILVNSWGRLYSFNTNNEIEIKKHEPKECYDLSKLDVSEITNMENLFLGSNFNNIHSSNGVGLHTDIYSTNRIGLHNNIHSLPISIP